jgi:hypothetical protein
MKKWIIVVLLTATSHAQTDASGSRATGAFVIFSPKLVKDADNGPMINAVINESLKALPNTGAKVLLPPGRWTFSTRIDLPRAIVLEGAGTEATILDYKGVGVAISHGDMRGMFAIQRGGIRDLALVSDGRRSGTIGIYCGGDPDLKRRISPADSFCQNVFYENILISGFDVGYEHGNNSFWITFINPTLQLNNIGATSSAHSSDAGEGVNWLGGRLNDNYKGAFVDDASENNLFGTGIDFNGNGGEAPQVTNSYIHGVNTHWEVHTGPMARGGLIRLRGGISLVDDAKPSMPWLIKVDQLQNNISIDGMEIYSKARVENLVDWSNGADPSSQLILRHLTGNHNEMISSLVNIIPGNKDVELDSYFGGASNGGLGITMTKKVGPCTLNIKSGLIVGISGC